MGRTADRRGGAGGTAGRMPAPRHRPAGKGPRGAPTETGAREGASAPRPPGPSPVGALAGGCCGRQGDEWKQVPGQGRPRRFAGGDGAKSRAVARAAASQRGEGGFLCADARIWLGSPALTVFSHKLFTLP